MTFIHREGYPTLIVIGICILIATVVGYLVHPPSLAIVLMFSLFIAFFFLQFFRNPSRRVAVRDVRMVYAPADGKVVAVEEAFEDEVLLENRLQVSIFMSPVNVHVNRSPIDGSVKYFKYHRGKYLVAWHPKSSTDNERTTILLENKQLKLVMRQIAGFLARRIVFYPKVGDSVEQGGEVGFIKFGSRVDLLLPLDAEVLVKPGDSVMAAETVIAKLGGD